MGWKILVEETDHETTCCSYRHRPGYSPRSRPGNGLEKIAVDKLRRSLNGAEPSAEDLAKIFGLDFGFDDEDEDDFEDEDDDDDDFAGTGYRSRPVTSRFVPEGRFKSREAEHDYFVNLLDESPLRAIKEAREWWNFPSFYPDEMVRVLLEVERQHGPERSPMEEFDELDQYAPRQARRIDRILKRLGYERKPLPQPHFDAKAKHDKRKQRKKQRKQRTKGRRR